MSFRSRCNLYQAKKKIQWSNSTSGKHCTERYWLVDNGDHSHIFLNLGMSLTFVKLISLQAEYRKSCRKLQFVLFFSVSF